MPEMQELLRAVRDTGQWRQWRQMLAGYARAEGQREKARWLYWLLPQELFARAYAQWVAWKSGDRRMLDQVDARMDDEQSPRIALSQWPIGEFLPIAQALDILFRDRGWLSERS